PAVRLHEPGPSISSVVREDSLPTVGTISPLRLGRSPPVSGSFTDFTGSKNETLASYAFEPAAAIAPIGANSNPAFYHNAIPRSRIAVRIPCRDYCGQPGC